MEKASRLVNYTLYPKSHTLLTVNMIQVTRLDGNEYYINPHQIESVELRPDTTLLMLSGKHVIVRENVEDIINKIVEYRRRIGGFKNEE
jgi:flagellar protein FlbD